ncbi:MAG TPA: hypothetical protein VK638_27865 [Edaphobacter sp.]|nr:hypothetical protein [Edaphobacter sp.]
MAIRTNVRRLALTALLTNILTLQLGCDAWYLKSDQKAKEAVIALKKLEARTDAGVSHRDYLVALGDTNFSVRQFLESERAREVPRVFDFSSQGYGLVFGSRANLGSTIEV